MATLLTMRTAIVNGIRATLPSLRTCRAYHGELDEEELGRAYHPAPSVLVVCTGVPRVRLEGGARIAEALWSAFVFVESMNPDKRDDEALALVTALLQTIPANRWGIDGAARAENVRAENLYSGAVDRKALAIWVVSWTQAVELPADVDAATLNAFATLHVERDLAPQDGTVEVTDRVILETAP